MEALYDKISLETLKYLALIPDQALDEAYTSETESEFIEVEFAGYEFTLELKAKQLVVNSDDERELYFLFAVAQVLFGIESVIGKKTSTWNGKKLLHYLSWYVVDEAMKIKPWIGIHWARLEKQNLHSLLKYLELEIEEPFQMMFEGGEVIDPVEAMTVGTIIENRNLSYYTHAFYKINLCKIYQSQLNSIQRDLITTKYLNGKGVIVHMGSATGQDEATAIVNMVRNVRSLLPFASEKTKLLLETPAGEGKKICSSFEMMNDFFLHFTSEERKRMGVCIDTCHVFAAGYDPLEYLQRWKVEGQIPIELVHYNDSKDPQGSRKDNHQRPGMGYIGEMKMTLIANWLNQEQIDAVIE